MPYHFFPMIARMRYISRWGLMRNTDPENVQEHSHMVAVLAGRGGGGGPVSRRQ